MLRDQLDRRINDERRKEQRAEMDERRHRVRNDGRQPASSGQVAGRQDERCDVRYFIEAVERPIDDLSVKEQRGERPNARSPFGRAYVLTKNNVQGNMGVDEAERDEEPIRPCERDRRELIKCRQRPKKDDITRRVTARARRPTGDDGFVLGPTVDPKDFTFGPRDWLNVRREQRFLLLLRIGMHEVANRPLVDGRADFEEEPHRVEVREMVRVPTVGEIAVGVPRSVRKVPAEPAEKRYEHQEDRWSASKELGEALP